MSLSFRPGIRTQIVFTLTILMAGAVAFVGFLFLKMEERNLMDQKIREGRQIVGALQRSLQDLAPESRGKTLLENLGRVVSLFAQGHPDLHFTVVNQDFDILADSRPDQVGKILRDMDLEKAMASGKIFAHGAGSEESFSLMKKTPLLISSAWLLGEQTAGGIRVEIPLEDLKETLFRSQSILFLYFFLTAFLLIVVGSFLLSRVIIKPLKKLVQMSDKIAEGNLELMSGPSGGNEVGRVLASFNHMISRLREDRSKMEEYIASLKRVNRELRLAQEGIIRSEKLASIGRLAAGVAHEVGNPTSAILGYLDLLSKGGLAEAEKAEVLKRAELEAERIRRIVRELLEFSRPSPRREEEVEVNTVIDRALSLLSHQKKVWEQIHVVREFQKALPRWKGNPHHLQQVMINLFLNAADALVAKDPGQIAGEKKIRITTQALSPEELGDSLGPAARRKKEGGSGADSSLFGIDRDVHPPSLQEVSSILQVDVEDSGPGIPAETLGRIFEPFYSTKPPGEGTGLGLAICLGILESYGGKISVQSESGKGARFTILLPIFE